MTQLAIKGFVTTPQEAIDRAVKLLKEHEPEDGYYLAFSGGKDSCMIKWLADKAEVKYEAYYNNTTIDPPELIKFIREYHPEVKWNNPKENMMHRVATAPKTPPTRRARWCCDEYKEQGGNGKVRVMGVRGAESPRRKAGWREISEDRHSNKVVCPIVHWSDEILWGIIISMGIPYCSLYDEGFKRLGCVGCPLAGEANMKREFERWPKYEANWKRAIIRNWENRKDGFNHRTGKPLYQSKFKTGEDLWNWWLTAKAPDYFRGDCQSMLLWTNEDSYEN